MAANLVEVGKHRLEHIGSGERCVNQYAKEIYISESRWSGGCVVGLDSVFKESAF